MNCLTEEQLMELYYNDEDEKGLEELKSHMANCSKCQKAFSNFCQELLEIEMPVVDGGHNSVEAALKLLEKGWNSEEEKELEVLGINEAAALFGVEPHNIINMLPNMPHFTFDNEIKFRKSELIRFIKSLESGACDKAPHELQSNIICLTRKKAG